jgi:hypothetical protein
MPKHVAVFAYLRKYFVLRDHMFCFILILEKTGTNRPKFGEDSQATIHQFKNLKRQIQNCDASINL